MSFSLRPPPLSLDDRWYKIALFESSESCRALLSPRPPSSRLALCTGVMPSITFSMRQKITIRAKAPVIRRYAAYVVLAYFRFSSPRDVILPLFIPERHPFYLAAAPYYRHRRCHYLSGPRPFSAALPRHAFLPGRCRLSSSSILSLMWWSSIFRLLIRADLPCCRPCRHAVPGLLSLQQPAAALSRAAAHASARFYIFAQVPCRSTRRRCWMPALQDLAIYARAEFATRPRVAHARLKQRCHAAIALFCQFRCKRAPRCWSAAREHALSFIVVVATAACLPPARRLLLMRAAHRVDNAVASHVAMPRLLPALPDCTGPSPDGLSFMRRIRKILWDIKAKMIVKVCLQESLALVMLRRSRERVCWCYATTAIEKRCLLLFAPAIQL